MSDKKTPQIRFEGFADDWEERELGEFGKSTGGTSIESEFSDDGNYKVISIGSYSENSKYNDQGIRTHKTNKTESKILNKDDLTMILNDKTASGNIIGRVLLIDADNTYVYNQRTERIEVDKNQFEPKFLYQLLNSHTLRSKIIKSAQGNTQIYVNWSAVSELEYNIPKSKAEQKEIAKYFATLDNLITCHQRKYDQLQTVKKSMLKKMFPQNGAKVPEIRFDGFTDDWEQRELGECLLVQRGGSPRPIEDYITQSADGINWIKIGDVKIGSRYITSTKEKIKPEGEKNSRKVYVGDLILSNSMSFGRPYIMQVDGCIHDGWLLIRDEKNLFNLEYLLQLLSSEYMLNQYKSLASGGVVNNLNSDLVQSTQILITDKEEQTKIGEYFATLDKLITTHQRELDKLNNIKKSMLEKMFV